MFRVRSAHLHFPNLIFQKKKNLRLLYIVRLMRELSNKFAMFFLPLFLFEKGQSLNLNFLANFTDFQKGMLFLISFYLLDYILMFVLTIPWCKVVKKFGLEGSLAIGNIFYALFLFFLFLGKTDIRLLYVATLADALQTNAFWPAYHMILSKNAHFSKLGKNLGLMHFMFNLVALIAPALGALVIVNFGYSILFLVSLVLVMIGIIFALLMEVSQIKDSISWKEFKKWWVEWKFRRLSLSFAGRYLNDVAISLWPLYVFLILGGVEKVGFLYTLSLFLSMIFTFFVGHFIDKNHRKRPFFISGGILSLIWFLRSKIAGIWSIALVDMAEKLTANFHWMFFDRVWLLRSKGSQAYSFFVYRELLIALSAIIFWISFAVLFFFFDGNWNILFAIGAVGVMLSLLVQRKHEA